MKVLHRCDMPPCVNPEHLFLGTQKQNMEDKVTKDRQRRWEDHPNSILTRDIVSRIRADYEAGDTSLSKVGKKYGLTFQHIHDIVRHKIWKDI